MKALYGFGRLIDFARAEPIAVAKHGRPVVVVMAVEFERLKALEARGDRPGGEAEIGSKGRAMADQAQKDRFVEALTELGGSAANGLLRETLQWDEATYNAVKNDLVAEGVVKTARGRGGSVSLRGAAEAEAEEAAPVVTRMKVARANGNGGNLGFEAELFKAADKLRGNMEPSDYKHVALGLIFLKHISDSFEAKRAELARGLSRRRRRPRRIRRRKRLLGAEGGALVASSGERQATFDRQADRRGDDRHREAQRNPEGRSAEGLCPARRSTR